MASYKTKDAARILNVSPTTIKRWAWHFQHRFRKDEAGHYVFSDDEIAMMRWIQQQLEQGAQLSQIELPGGKAASNSETAAAREKAPVLSLDGLRSSREKSSERDQRVLDRLEALELQMDQKANEVVGFQVLQHRKELDELHDQIMELNTELERLSESIAKLEKMSQRDRGHGGQPPIRRRRFLGMLFT